jgi:glycosyltransferase involved in cell wall biosynthesis
MIKQLQSKESIDYFGEIQGEDKKTFLNTSDIFILPSYTEGLPISMLEAMASRLPLVVTPVGAISEIVENEVNGFIIPVGDYKALAEKILILANDNDLRKRIGENNFRKMQQKYDIKLIIKKLEGLYESLMKS